MVLGIGLGGFFDGILLHQILQWHHLLSLVPGIDDLRTQILWDGYFHLLMYVLAGAGFWGLWMAHRRGEPLGQRALTGSLMAGFGLWHILDSILSHWVLGIHRIKVDSANPLLWDLGWFAVFGLLPLAVGWTFLKGGGGPGNGAGPRGRPVALGLMSAMSLGAGTWALQPPSDQPLTAVVFRSDLEAEAISARLEDLGAELVWADPSMGVVVVDLPHSSRWDLYRHGALLVSGTGVPAGCFSWSAA
ncbi:DUF2243 domain-containing protein [Roseivivax sp. CAU 1761]